MIPVAGGNPKKRIIEWWSKTKEEKGNKKEKETKNRE